MGIKISGLTSLDANVPYECNYEGKITDTPILKSFALIPQDFDIQPTEPANKPFVKTETGWELQTILTKYPITGMPCVVPVHLIMSELDGCILITVKVGVSKLLTNLLLEVN